MISKKKLDKDPYSEISDYLLNFGTREHPVAKALREHVEHIRFGHMQITPQQGQFLHFMVKLTQARNILEIGTFKGYSSICMATALPPNGSLTTIDFKAEHFDEAEKWWSKADILHKIQTVHGDGIETLEQINQKYDFIFIDADKKNYDKYLEPALKCLSPNGLLIFDNTLWYGNVADPENQSLETVSIRTLNEKIKNHPAIEMCLMPFADGMTLIKHKE